jgi:hypothetical protein
LICGFVGATAALVSGKELSLDQKLIVACYRVDLPAVVQNLRAGANVNAKFGEIQEEVSPFLDQWTGGTPVSSDSWTSLVALASASEYPDPPQEFPRIWENAAQVRKEQSRIGKNVVEERRTAQLNIFYMLLSHGADINSADDRNGTALHRAVDNANTPLVRTMLRFGANANTKRHIYIDGPDNVTPLHCACNSKEILQLLLDHGADPSAKDSDGDTPADWVALRNDRDFDLVTTPDGARIRPRNLPK